MGIKVESSPPLNPSQMPSAAPQTNGVSKTANGTSTPNDHISANDNIRRFEAPSRTLSPLSHTLFHNKTRCFV